MTHGRGHDLLCLTSPDVTPFIMDTFVPLDRGRPPNTYSPSRSTPSGVPPPVEPPTSPRGSNTESFPSLPREVYTYPHP